MKYLIIVGVVAVLLLLLYLRLRPFIRMWKQMFGVARQFRQAVREEPARSTASGGGPGDMLVRCDACETWVPASRSIKLRTPNASYCSRACLENSVQGSTHKAAG